MKVFILFRQYSEKERMCVIFAVSVCSTSQ